MKHFMVVLLCIALYGCLGLPEGVSPVSDFDKTRYLGTWYEIARLDHPFERGLTNIYAEYSLREDGGIKVLNRGYSPQEGAWEEAEGKAYFVESDKLGYLKVSFFGPFYGSYVVFELDHENYDYAYVSGPDFKYLWLLARAPHPDPEVLQRFKEKAGALGFAVDQLIVVEHDQL